MIVYTVQGRIITLSWCLILLQPCHSNPLLEHLTRKKTPSTQQEYEQKKKDTLSFCKQVGISFAVNYIRLTVEKQARDFHGYDHTMHKDPIGTSAAASTIYFTVQLQQLQAYKDSSTENLWATALGHALARTVPKPQLIPDSWKAKKEQ